MDKNKFFRQVTLKICGNLNIEETMNSVLQFQTSYYVWKVEMYYMLSSEILKGINVVISFFLYQHNHLLELYKNILRLINQLHQILFHKFQLV